MISGSGTLQNVDTETASVPSGVTVTEILVQYGDTVAKGDSVGSSITAGVADRVKAIYAKEDDTVEDVMVKSGSLALLSLDGYMEVDIETDKLSKDDTVTVTLSVGDTVSGTVDYTLSGVATILLTVSLALDEEVTVTDSDGNNLGTGKLTIHNSLAVTGYAGTISAVKVDVNDKVSASTKNFPLSDTTTTAAYNALLRERSEQEKILLELLTIQNSSGLTAPIAGSVYSVADLDFRFHRGNHRYCHYFSRCQRSGVHQRGREQYSRP